MEADDVAAVMAGPVPANPFVRDVIVMDGDHYHFLEFDWLANPRIRVGDAALPIGPRGPITEAALSAPQIEGLRTWMRFPSFEVVETADGYRVTIRDVRYARLSRSGIGYAAVELDRELRPR
jgi:inner membrane protein